MIWPVGTGTGGSDSVGSGSAAKPDFSGASGGVTWSGVTMGLTMPLGVAATGSTGGLVKGSGIGFGCAGDDDTGLIEAELLTIVGELSIAGWFGWSAAWSWLGVKRDWPTSAS